MPARGDGMTTRSTVLGLWKSPARSARDCVVRASGISCGTISTPWPRLSVVIPTLNEARNLPHVFSRLPADLHEVIIIDGHSVDDTLVTPHHIRPDGRITLQTSRAKATAL